jgi:hypothetical protein
MEMKKMYQAYGTPGDVALFPIIPSTGIDYLKGLLLQANYNALNIAPEPHIGVAL